MENQSTTQNPKDALPAHDEFFVDVEDFKQEDLGSGASHKIRKFIMFLLMCGLVGFMVFRQYRNFGGDPKGQHTTQQLAAPAKK